MPKHVLLAVHALHVRPKKIPLAPPEHTRCSVSLTMGAQSHILCFSEFRPQLLKRPNRSDTSHTERPHTGNYKSNRKTRNKWTHCHNVTFESRALNAYFFLPDSSNNLQCCVEGSCAGAPVMRNSWANTPRIQSLTPESDPRLNLSVLTTKPPAQEPLLLALPTVSIVATVLSGHPPMNLAWLTPMPSTLQHVRSRPQHRKRRHLKRSGARCALLTY